MAKGTDWVAIEHEYVTTGISLRALEDKHGANLRSLARYSRKGEWTKKREEYVNRVAAQCQQISAEHDVVAILSQRGEIMLAYQDGIRALRRVAKQIAEGQLVGSKDVTEVAKAIALYMDSDERFFNKAEAAKVEYTFSVTEGSLTVEEALG